MFFSPSHLAASSFVACCAALFVPANDDVHVQWTGRPDYRFDDGAVGFSYLGTGVRLSVTKATYVRVHPVNSSTAYKLTFAQSTEGYAPWQGVSWVTPSDGCSGLQPGLGGVVIASSNKAATFTVQAQVNMPPQYWQGSAGGLGALLGFSTDGTVQPLAARPKPVLHFLGDSITASTNVHGGWPQPYSCADEGYQADWSASYSGIICKYLDADCSVVAVGGKGLVRNCCDDGLRMPDYYQRIAMTDPTPTFTWNDTVPSAMVVYLGTNDYSKGEAPGLDQAFTAALLQLMYNVTRVWYGTPASPANVTFFPLLGPMSPVLPAPATLSAVAQGRAQGYSIVLVNATQACGPDLKGCIDGCAGHPGVASHRAIAATLLPILQATLGGGTTGVVAVG